MGIDIHAFLALEIAALSPFEIRVPLNGAQMGHTLENALTALGGALRIGARFRL